MTPTARRFDIHCRVVDHYGDAGFAWRLARMLAGVQGREVRLWIDDLATLARIAPGIDPAAPRQVVDGVGVASIALADDEVPGDVLVEAFGCGLSERVQDAMERATRDAAAGGTPRRAPIWLLLEYLSAEAWVDGVHGLASPHPRRPLMRWFYCPGFTARSGGLLREPGLLAQREDFDRQEAGKRLAQAALEVFLFCYDNPALPALLGHWAGGAAPVHLTVPVGVAPEALGRFLEAPWPRSTARLTRGALSIDIVPFVAQPAFDERLWRSDFAIVRGEDSFVRAQWAARPFAWHPYRQDGDAQRDKLEAFAARYLDGADRGIAAAWLAFQRALDGEDGVALVAAWDPLAAGLPQLRRHALRWSERLARLPELSAELVSFAEMRYN